MRTCAMGSGARAIRGSLSAAVRVLVCASVLYAAAAGASADEYVASENLLCGGRAGPSPWVVTGLIVVGLGTGVGLLMAALKSRRPAHPVRLRHVEAGLPMSSVDRRVARRRTLVS
jgi:hypothetical protein